jgi:hypothetical protein
VKPLSIGGIFGYALLNYLSTQNVKLPFIQNYFLTHVVFYGVVLIGFAAVIVEPPKFLGWFALLGEESYALYAVHFAFVIVFWTPGHSILNCHGFCDRVFAASKRDRFKAESQLSCDDRRS